MKETIWVAYIDQQQQILIELPFQETMTANQAIEQSGILHTVNIPHPLQLGIFGLKVDGEVRLHAGDRVEIYRPLTINPKEIRRNRAEKNPTSRYLMKQRLRGNRFRHGDH